MEDPIITRHGTEIVFVYENYVKLCVRNPTTRMGRPEIEVDITLKPQHHPTGNGRVYRGTLGPLSKTNVRETLKRCNETAPGIDWPTILDDFCWRVVDKLREPEKIKRVGNGLLPTDRPMYQLAPLLQKDQPTILYGDGGVGKSLVATFLSVLVSDGIDTCGLRAVPGKVLYIDWETNSETVHERVWAIKRALKQQTLLIDRELEVEYLRADKPLKAWADQLPAMISESGIELVVIDSLGMALAGSFNDGDEVIGIFQAIRTLATTTLIIDHQGKAEGAAALGPIGSRYKHNLARSVWEIRKVDSEDGFRVGLFHRKTNRGRKHPPFGFNIEIEEDDNQMMVNATFTRIAVEEDDGLAQGLSTYERLRAVLKNGALGLRDIYAEMPDVNEGAVRSTLKRHFQQINRGTYGLKAHAEDPKQARLEH